MSMGEDGPDLDWDGGWERAIDEGEGLEDILTGPVDPYDRASSNQAAEGFESTPVLRPYKDIRNPRSHQ